MYPILYLMGMTQHTSVTIGDIPISSPQHISCIQSINYQHQAKTFILRTTLLFHIQQCILLFGLLDNITRYSCASLPITIPILQFPNPFTKKANIFAITISNPYVTLILRLTNLNPLYCSLHSKKIWYKKP
jgi:hypothetical protein